MGESEQAGSIPGRRRYSLRLSLLLLVMVCVLPAVIVATHLVITNYQLQKQQIYSNTIMLARKISFDLDRQLSRLESGLRVLASSSHLATGDLYSFHQQARNAVKSQIAYNYILTDRNGRQLMNTLVPYGMPLPTAGTPTQLMRVFDTGEYVLTDMFIGPVTKKYAIAIGVPVYRGDTIAYSLNIGLSPDRIAEILDRHKIPEGWIARVLDGSGTIIAHSQKITELVGKKAVDPLPERVAVADEESLESLSRDGVPVVTSFSRSALWRWSVAISAPKSLLKKELYQQLVWVVSGIILALLLGIWLASRLAERVISSVRDLNNAARALCNGNPVELPRVQIKEADAVGVAMVQISEIMKQVRHRAYHDVLTGLANRALFEELLRRQFSLVERSKGRLAILAIDLDGFKAVNDRQGHAAGDEVLKIAARRMTHTIRSSDTAARIGGDEFLILLCDDEQAGAMQMAERLIASLSLPYPGVKTPVSASIGVAVYPQCGKTIEALIESADRALYRAKDAGKKRAVLSQD